MAPITQHPGETVTASGIYRVLHTQKHDGPGAITLVAGQTFPECSVCGADVVFLLIHSAPTPQEDKDLGADVLRRVARNIK